MLAAARLVLTQESEGSSPSGPTWNASFFRYQIMVIDLPVKQGMKVRSLLPELLVLVEQRSAHLPVKQEAAGSNPVGDAW